MTDHSIFSVLGIEIEFMLVDKDTLNVDPKCDVLLKELAGHQTNDVTLDEIELSNELVMHVLELKNNGPRTPDEPIAIHFQNAIIALLPLLNAHGLQVLPTAAHPWMDPHKETVRWSHGDRSIYKKYDTIFNCQGHGWSNLQSMHINLPFANDEEFAALHSVIRLLLPLLPALCASSPIIEERATGFLDTRLVYYAENQRIIPSISGEIIPEVATSESHYRENILLPMYRDIRPHDPEGKLQHQWLNSHGAIAKFDDYKAIEIRVIDSQECINANISIARLIHALLKYWHEHETYHLTHPCSTKMLKSLYDKTLKTGLDTSIHEHELLKQWQLPTRNMRVRDAWSMLIERVRPALDSSTLKILEAILDKGNLSERILKACRGDFSRPQLTQVYRALGECLLNNQLFQV